MWHHPKQTDADLLKKFGCLDECFVELIELEWDESYDLASNSASNDRKKWHTCYICMSKFSTHEDLQLHKYVHSESDESQMDDDYISDKNYISLVNERDFLHNMETSLQNEDVTKNNPDKEEITDNKQEHKTAIRKENEHEDNKGKEQLLNQINNSCDNYVEENNGTVEENIEALISKNTEAIAKDNIQLNSTINKNTVDSKINNCNQRATSGDDQTRKYIKCETCHVYFDHPSDIKTHPKNSEDKCKFSCVKCTRVFKTKYGVVIHLIEHLNNVDTLYSCTLCDRTFNNSIKHKKHIWSHTKIPSNKHKNTSKESAQTKSPKVTKKNIQHRSDTNKVYSKGEQTVFTCELCYDIFHSKNELNNHISFHKSLVHPTTKVKTIEECKEGIKLKAENMPPDNFSLEVQKIGPQSYAVNYKGAPTQTTKEYWQVNCTKKQLKTKELASATSDNSRRRMCSNNAVYTYKPPCLESTSSSNLAFGSEFLNSTSPPSNFGATTSTNCNLNYAQGNFNGPPGVNYSGGQYYANNTSPAPYSYVVNKDYKSLDKYGNWFRLAQQNRSRSFNVDNRHPVIPPKPAPYQGTNQSYVEAFTAGNATSLNQISSYTNQAMIPPTTVDDSYKETVGVENSVKMFEDQDFISLNQFEQLCKSKEAIKNLTSAAESDNHAENSPLRTLLSLDSLEKKSAIDGETLTIRDKFLNEILDRKIEIPKPFTIDDKTKPNIGNSSGIGIRERCRLYSKDATVPDLGVVGNTEISIISLLSAETNDLLKQN